MVPSRREHFRPTKLWRLHLQLIIYISSITHFLKQLQQQGSLMCYNLGQKKEAFGSGNRKVLKYKIINKLI
jgi:hypothetical protein